eukprot:m.60620 g.60620  ORF g.60620 m.60620 type:complete len:298 (-) comp19202_c0_seq3:64-957(-)
MDLLSQMLGPRRGTFRRDYRCHSAAMLGRDDVDTGGKIVMPVSALEVLARLEIQYPMLFKLENPQGTRHTHCGVLEFTADEGIVYLPHWMMQNLWIQEGSLITITNVSLKKATYAKFRPSSVDFLEISNPTAVLERVLRGFACLTQGDEISIKYNKKNYDIQVLEVAPRNEDGAVSIIECDVNLDFAAPMGYVEPTPKPKQQEEKAAEEEPPSPVKPVSDVKFFPGQATRLDGKAPRLIPGAPTKEDIEDQQTMVAPWKLGKISFRTKRSRRKAKPTESNEFSSFTGESQTLKGKKK